MAQIVISGNIGSDPELRRTPGGKSITSFRVADNRKWTDGAGAAHEETHWYTVETWEKLAERCVEVLTKGMLVRVEGCLDVRTYEKGDGGTGVENKATASEIYINVFNNFDR